MRPHVSYAPFSLVLLLAMALALGLFAPPAAAITFGEVDYTNACPDVGCLVYDPPGDPGPMVVCTGMLVHPRVFLTAGHATIMAEQDPTLLPPAYVSFAANAFDKSDPSTWREIDRVITHPDYHLRHDQTCNDVGVIILRKHFGKGVPLANLPYAGYLDYLQAAGLLRLPGEGGVPLKLVGYGGTQEWPPPVQAPGDGWRRFADSDYLALEPGWLITQTNPATGNGGTWVGDSGGPNFWIEPDGTLVLVALTGHGAAMAPGWSWRVDIPATLDFISAMVAAVDAGRL
jgi:hypothetical protein